MDDFEKLVQAERRKLVATALAAGAVDKEAFDSLDRLSKLASEAKPQRQWLIPVVILVLLTIFIGLLFKKQEETEIELDLMVTELHFHFTKQGPITEDQFLRSLKASALDGIEVDGAVWSAPSGRTCSISAELAGKREKGDAITLPAIIVPKDWELGVSRSGAETDFELTDPSASGHREDFAITASVRGTAVLSTNCTPDGKNRRAHWNGPGSLTMRISPATILLCESAIPVKFARQVEFDNLRLYTVERYQTSTAPVDRRHSSLLSGTLYLDVLNAKAVPLRPFEDLSFGSSRGYIRAIAIPPDSKPASEELRLQAHAAVQQMKLGSGVSERSQMPSWLEMLAAQTGIALLWASVIYVFGVIYAVLRWLKVTR